MDFFKEQDEVHTVQYALSVGEVMCPYWYASLQVQYMHVSTKLIVVFVIIRPTSSALKDRTLYCFPF